MVNLQQIYVEKPAPIDLSQIRIPAELPPEVLLGVVGASLAGGIITSLIVCNRTLKDNRSKYKGLVEDMFHDSLRFMESMQDSDYTKKARDYVEKGFAFVDREVKKMRAYDPFTYSLKRELEKQSTLAKSYAIIKIGSYDMQRSMWDFYRTG